MESKVHKVKAQPLGKEVILDGERCIMCTRCVRFCDEVTGTSELGLLNRGDRTEIAVSPGKELNNALAGTVVDLCPVGALTHRRWRFNTRIWYTRQTDTICPGCSTGCNCRVAVRDDRVVQVKGRINAEVNKEWMCDEGRYGFERFLPASRLAVPQFSGRRLSWEQAYKEAASFAGPDMLVFLAPDLLLEDYWQIGAYLQRCSRNARIVLAYRGRHLNDVEKLLVSPDYAANFRGAELSGLIAAGRNQDASYYASDAGNLEAQYDQALTELRAGNFERILCVGDRAFSAGDLDQELCEAVSKAPYSMAVLTDANSLLCGAAKLVLPGRSILEKSGLLVNRRNRLQYSSQALDFPQGSEPEWRIFGTLTRNAGGHAFVQGADREMTLHYLNNQEHLSGLTIRRIKAGGIDLNRDVV